MRLSTVQYQVESLSVVNTDDGSDHFGYNDHVPQMSLYNFGFFIWRGLFFGFPEFLDESHRFPLQSSRKTPAGTGVHQFHKLFTENDNKS